MQAKDVMTSPVVTVGPDASVTDVARLLLERHISAAPVVDGSGTLLGVVSEGDLMRRPEAGTERRPSWWLTLISEPQDEAREYLKSHGLHARDVMTRHVLTVEEDASLQDIATLLEKHRIKRVPVMRAGKVVGIVSRANLLQALVAQSRPPAPQADDRAAARGGDGRPQGDRRAHALHQRRGFRRRRPPLGHGPQRGGEERHVRGGGVRHGHEAGVRAHHAASQGRRPGDLTPAGA